MSLNEQINQSSVNQLKTQDLANNSNQVKTSIDLKLVRSIIYSDHVKRKSIRGINKSKGSIK